MITIRSGWQPRKRSDAPTKRAAVRPGAVADKLLQLYREDGGRLFGLLDSAREETILAALVDGVDCESLYRGTKNEKHFGKAPFLVHFAPGCKLFYQLVSRGWGDSWGVVFASREPFGNLLEHFQRFVLARRQFGEDQDVFFFRFYDPRVLRAYLPTCTESEIGLLFGPVRRFYVESEGGDAVLVFDRQERSARSDVSDAAPTSQTDSANADKQPDPSGDQQPILLVRQEQVATFREYLVRDFEDHAMLDLRDAFPNKTEPMSDAELRAFVQTGRERAARYRVRTERGVTAYLRYMAKYGDNFDKKYAGAKEILENKGIPGTLKVKRLAQWHRGGGAQG